MTCNKVTWGVAHGGTMRNMEEQGGTRRKEEEHGGTWRKEEECGGRQRNVDAMPHRAPAEPRIRHAVSYGLLTWFDPLPRFIISAYSLIPPFLIPFPHVFHISNIHFVSCPPLQFPFQTPNPKPRSILLHITSPCSIFVSRLLCPNPCPFPSTLLCSF